MPFCVYEISTFFREMSSLFLDLCNIKNISYFLVHQHWAAMHADIINPIQNILIIIHEGKLLSFKTLLNIKD